MYMILSKLWESKFLSLETTNLFLTGHFTENSQDPRQMLRINNATDL